MKFFIFTLFFGSLSIANAQDEILLEFGAQITVNAGSTMTIQCAGSVKAKAAVCNWNGNNYQPYAVETGAAIGKAGYGFTKLEECALATSASRSMICNWNGDNYQPYVIVTGAALGNPGYGFTKLNDCLSAIRD